MKYIIDVPDGTKWIEAYYTVDHFQYQGQAIIVDSLIPYTESDLSPLVDEAVEAIEDEVWEFIGFLFTGMSPEERYECFDKVFSQIIVSTMSYQEAKSKYEAWKKWKKQKDEIHVGDEIVGIYSDGEKTPPLVVLKVEGNYYFGIYSKTGDFVQGGLNYEKTGRHFAEVAELLEKMRGEE